MKKLIVIAKGTGKVILALLAGITSPVLIWVALGVVINQKIQEKKLKRQTAPTLGEILDKGKTYTQPLLNNDELLVKAGIYNHERTNTKPCWEVLDCPPEKCNSCPDSVRREIPSFIAAGGDKTNSRLH